MKCIGLGGNKSSPEEVWKETFLSSLVCEPEWLRDSCLDRIDEEVEVVARAVKAEDVEAISAKAGESGKIGNVQSNPQIERRTFCLVNVAT